MPADLGRDFKRATLAFKVKVSYAASYNAICGTIYEEAGSRVSPLACLKRSFTKRIPSQMISGRNCPL